MSDYTSGAITFTGLGNGTDFDALIDGLIEVERQRVTRLETWRQTWENKIEAFQELNTKMLALKTTLSAMNTTNEFLTKIASSGDSSALTASASSSAQEASHSVEIGQLAQNDIFITSSGTGALTSSVTSADTSLTLSYAGESITIDNISAGTTLQGLVNMINNDPDARNKVRATTIYDGSVYHLQVYGMDMGTDNQVVVSNTGSLIFGVSDFQNSQDAQNSQLKVDGFPSAAGGWIERATNSVDDVIVGLTLNLKEANPGTTIQLTVDTDMDAVKENVRDFVDQLNEVRTKIQELTKFDETTESGSILTGNYGVDMISQKLKGITADIGVGFEYYNQTTGAGDKYSALSQLGILTDAEQGSLTYGLLVIDEDKLDEVLQDDPEAVAQLMSAYYEGESRSSDFTYVSYIDGTTQAGNYEVQIVSDGSSITSATINGQAAIISGWEITGASGTDEAGLLIRLDNHGAGTYTGTVSLKLGKAGQLVNELTDLTKPYNAATYEGGPLAILERNYQDIMDNIDDKIAWEEDRIEKMERNLRDKYARLDATLGYYDQLSASLTSQIAQLDES